MVKALQRRSGGLCCRFNASTFQRVTNYPAPACSFSNAHIVQKRTRHVLVCNSPKTSACNAVAWRSAFSARAASASYLRVALPRDVKARARPSPDVLRGAAQTALRGMGFDRRLFSHRHGWADSRLRRTKRRHVEPDSTGTRTRQI